ncbi:alcohol dehydrogenase catalytic domain-containing protein [Ilumatobacter sp.]|uniref:alcohol dehydrogenase catalytic domain-containing protein n=1 Tax=Ilumatobacter sp. TaxID=1967498 RepID=UPI003AF67BFA
MRAVVLTETGTPLTVVDDQPEPHGDGGELIDVTACGVCHSDIHVVDGDFGSSLPIILGHEVTGVHPELGPVMVYAPWGCRSCAQCADGLEMMCADATEAGLFTDGGYAERMWVKDRRYLAALDGLDPVAAAPLACGGLTAYRAVKHTLEALRAREGGGRALVVGAGGLGQYAIRFLRLQTDAHVTALDTAAAKRDQARSIGADTAIGPDDVTEPFDVVLDFIGADVTLAGAVGRVARRGLVVVIGLAGGRVPFGFGAVPHEAQLMSSVWGSRAELDELLAFVRREPDIVQPVETLPLASAQIAHDRLRAGDVRGRLVLTP